MLRKLAAFTSAAAIGLALLVASGGGALADPALTVSPGTVRYASDSITVAGMGWAAGAVIDVTFSGTGAADSISCLGSTQVQADGSGSFSLTVPVASIVDAETGSCQATANVDGSSDGAVQVPFVITD